MEGTAAAAQRTAPPRRAWRPSAAGVGWTLAAEKSRTLAGTLPSPAAAGSETRNTTLSERSGKGGGGCRQPKQVLNKETSRETSNEKTMELPVGGGSCEAGNTM